MPRRRLFSTVGRQLQQLHHGTGPAGGAGASKPAKPVSRHYGFYRDFGRPLAKVVALTFTTYYGMILLQSVLDEESEEVSK